MKTIFYDFISINNKNIFYAYTDEGICFIGSPNKDINEINNFIKVDQLLKKENSFYEKSLLKYLQGKLHDLNLNIDLTWATKFQKSVYKELKKIGYGQTTTYSQLAINLKKPTSIRAVASAVAKNPILFVIPCHRVLRKDGSLGGFRAGIEFKKELLNLENS
ncbi:methylated-DNA--[protein]-cysteine S-methyltransferase [Companilactobacillus sp. DQM5]|uniref:methylated-DNA--[protein]-cysteine S-methyltransferase n=1 Tax=Companilactobacillus sp. DQM5 TaxID=3463359 RepID=UPI004057EBC0